MRYRSAPTLVVAAVAVLAQCREVRSRVEPDAPRAAPSARASDAASEAGALRPEVAIDASVAALPEAAAGAESPKRPQSLSSESERVKRRPCAIAAMGDSLTDWRSHGGGYLKLLQQQCPQSLVDNYGRGGDMVNQMRRRFFAEVLQSGKPKYTHVIIFGGVNDLYSDLTAGRTVEKISRDLLTMYQAAHERGMRVVAVTVAPWGGFSRYYNAKRGGDTASLNAWIRSQPKEGTVDAVVDAYGLLSCGAAEKLCDGFQAPFRDGLHFGPAGHRVLGEALFSQVFHECL